MVTHPFTSSLCQDGLVWPEPLVSYTNTLSLWRCNPKPDEPRNRATEKDGEAAEGVYL